ncbi:hypothetical protein Bbelb_031990 [Branchiostoma belcheri]|nr:hypothetical protein Bbelb_031990 [Branchiostoma belcheri]
MVGRPVGREAWWDCGLVLCLCTLFFSSGEGLPFKFASVYGDHMVLQQAPHRAVLWGQGDPGSNVTVQITPGDSEVKTVNSDAGVWNVTLDPMKAGGPYTVKAIQYFKGPTPLAQVIELDDIMFGDVWVCSGQSNMQFTVMMAGGPYTVKAIQYFKGPKPLAVVIELDNIMFGDVWVCSGQSNMQFTVMMAGGPYNVTARQRFKDPIPLDVVITLVDVMFGDVWVCSGQSNMQFTVMMVAGGPYNVTAIQYFKGVTPLEAIRKLFNVMFGDVWVCSGQSNMQFTVMMGFNSTEEILAANNYPNIRLFTAGLVGSDTPLSNLDRVEQPWSVASAASVGGGMWNYFSALCWFYGRDLYDTLQYPIGLVASSYEGTPIEYWSSPEVLQKCDVDNTPTKRDKKQALIVPGDNQNSVLWNAMIHPLLNMTIKGAIWYQGESNADHPDSYLCLFPAMIDSWRSSWYQGTGGQTDPTFPFGFMQISGNVPGSTNLGYPEIRWHQTADFGYVPNPKMEKVFMAVAMDLWRPDSPWLTVHPQDKQDMGTRLSLAARAVAYGDKNIKFQGPFPSSLQMGNDTIVVQYGPEAGHIEVRSTGGFEVCCSSVKNTCDKDTAMWVDAPMVHAPRPNATDSITVSTTNCHKIVTAIRYAWRETPCSFKQCPVYGMGSMQVPLPAPPFLMYMRVPQNKGDMTG